MKKKAIGVLSIVLAIGTAALHVLQGGFETLDVPLLIAAVTAGIGSLTGKEEQPK